MEYVRILFARRLKLKQCDFLAFFQLPGKFSMGFSLERVCDPNIAEMFFGNVSP